QPARVRVERVPPLDLPDPFVAPDSITSDERGVHGWSPRRTEFRDRVLDRHQQIALLLEIVSRDARAPVVDPLRGSAALFPCRIRLSVGPRLGSKWRAVGAAHGS